MAVDTLEAPATEVKPPTLGDKFRANFEKLEHPETSDLEQAPKITGEPDKVEPEKKEEVVKPSSPLDAILSKEPEAKPAEIPDVTQEFDDKKPNWSRAREVMKTQSGRIKEYETEISRLKAEPKVDNGAVAQLTQERDQLKEQNAKYQKDIMAINAEYSDEYQGLVNEKQGFVSKLEARIKAHGGDADSVLAALALPEGKVRTAQIEQALLEVDDKSRGRIDRLIDNIEEHDEKIADFRKDLPSKWEEIQARKESREREQQAENLKTLETQFGKIVEELPKKVTTLREVSDDVEGAAEWNASIRGARERALTVLKPNGSDFPHTVETAWKGEHYDDLAKYTVNLHKNYTEAMSRLKEFDASGPDFKGGKKPANEPKMTASSKYHQKLAELKGAEQD
jgi:chromosome segregation ATPase